jgi:hypothetical protein
MTRLFWIAIPLLLAAATVQAEWNWPWEKSDSLDTGDSAAGFLGDLFGGKRTQLELDVEMDIGMRYDMQHSGSDYSRYGGEQDAEHFTDSQRPYYSQPYAMPRGHYRSMQAEPPRQPVRDETGSYRAAFAAQRRVAEQMRTSSIDAVPRFEEAAGNAAEESDTEAMFRQLEARRSAAFREMEERRMRYAAESSVAPVTSTD